MQALAWPRTRGSWSMTLLAVASSYPAGRASNPGFKWGPSLSLGVGPGSGPATGAAAAAAAAVAAAASTGGTPRHQPPWSSADQASALAKSRTTPQLDMAPLSGNTTTDVGPTSGRHPSSGGAAKPGLLQVIPTQGLVRQPSAPACAILAATEAPQSRLSTPGGAAVSPAALGAAALDTTPTYSGEGALSNW